MKVHAAVAREARGPFTLEELELDEPHAGEVLVRVVAVGLCHTDLSARDAALPVPQPIVLGHEGAGIVEAVGSAVRQVAPGDHVVLSFNSCGGCRNCQRGRPAYCAQFFPLNFGGVRGDGSLAFSQNGSAVHGSFFGQSAFADYALATERSLVKVSDDVPLELAAPLACGIQTGAGTVLNSLAIEAGSSVAVFGAGSVGLSAVMAARAIAASPIVVVDVNRKRLDLASELGATHTLDPADGEIVPRIQELTGAGVEYAIEATGVPAVLRNAVDSLDATGTCAMVGAAPFGSEVCFDTATLAMGRTVRGVVEGDSVPALFIPQLIDMQRAGHFPYDRLITEFPLSQINEAAEASLSGQVIKAVLRP
jgi:aryl-alcohol dehydrogenase